MFIYISIYCLSSHVVVKEILILFLILVMVLEMESKLLIAAILISSWVSGAFSEGVSDPSCVTSLLPCQPYLKGDVKPSPQCCLNLKDAVNKDLPCLCNVLSNEAILKEFNVTKQEAMAFPSKCGIKTPDCSSTNGSHLFSFQDLDTVDSNIWKKDVMRMFFEFINFLICTNYHDYRWINIF